MSFCQSILFGLIAAAVCQAWASQPWRNPGGEWKECVCGSCLDSGFSGYGRGYDDVCSECGGQSPYARGVDESFYAIRDALAEEM